ncbi:hypothetical protein CDL15_Pgr023441 [Punica granatum]|uniref:Uncharacterized protein n=1 Tax=Punica granatum TaxID=22663 RepID=A0A218W794_PUNGR|nr:hypothetical protein CDL15_Pgr023441 [Punica granatum]
MRKGSRDVPEMRKGSRDVPEMRESSRDVPEGFAICTGRIPNEQHGSKAPTQWTCGVRGVLPGGFARCGVFCPAVCMVQKSSRDVPKCGKVVGTYPKCGK